MNGVAAPPYPCANEVPFSALIGTLPSFLLHLMHKTPPCDNLNQSQMINPVNSDQSQDTKETT